MAGAPSLVHRGRVFQRDTEGLMELSRRVDLTYANLSVLKNNRGRAIRFSTLAAICSVLDCEVGDLLVVEPHGEA